MLFLVLYVCCTIWSAEISLYLFGMQRMRKHIKVKLHNNSRLRVKTMPCDLLQETWNFRRFPIYDLYGRRALKKLATKWNNAIWPMPIQPDSTPKLSSSSPKPLLPQQVAAFNMQQFFTWLACSRYLVWDTKQVWQVLPSAHSKGMHQRDCPTKGGVLQICLKA